MPRCGRQVTFGIISTGAERESVRAFGGPSLSSFRLRVGAESEHVEVQEASFQVLIDVGDLHLV